MKTEKEILQVMLNNVKEVKYYGGFCVLKIALYGRGFITAEELSSLSSYLKSHLPKKKRNSRLCWKHGNVFWRRRWLRKQISLLENN